MAGRARAVSWQRGTLKVRTWRFHWLQLAVHAVAWGSAVWLVWLYNSGAFVVDPVRETQTYSGKAALVALVLSLACTPLQTLTGWQPLARARRPLGLYSFAYASFHFFNYIALDYGLRLDLLWQGLVDERYVLVGLAAGLILSALALTSTRGWQKRLGPAWKRLHRLVYLAGILAVIHFLWLVKDPQEPLRYAVLLALLLVLRLPPVRRTAVSLRRRALAGLKPLPSKKPLKTPQAPLEK